MQVRTPHPSSPVAFDQPYARYTEADHRVWKTLYARQRALLGDRVCAEFMNGLRLLDLPADRVPCFETLNKALVECSGWQLVAVDGLIDDVAFFRLLSERKFPVTWWLRREDQLDYLEEPDLFHDLFGHVPLLANRVFGDFIQQYATLGLDARDPAELAQLGRLYWFTVEFGLIRSRINAAGLAIYGAGIASSPGETRHSLEADGVVREPFDIDRIIETAYRTDVFQMRYFIIDDFSQLFGAIDALRARLTDRRRALLAA